MSKYSPLHFPHMALWKWILYVLECVTNLPLYSNVESNIALKKYINNRSWYLITKEDGWERKEEERRVGWRKCVFTYMHGWEWLHVFTEGHGVSNNLTNSRSLILILSRTLSLVLNLILDNNLVKISAFCSLLSVY